MVEKRKILTWTYVPVHGKLGFDFNTRTGRQSYSFQKHFFGVGVKFSLMELSKSFLDSILHPDLITRWFRCRPILMSDNLKWFKKIALILNNHCRVNHSLAKAWLIVAIVFHRFTMSKFSYRVVILDGTFENFRTVYLQIMSKCSMRHTLCPCISHINFLLTKLIYSPWV